MLYLYYIPNPKRAEMKEKKQIHFYIPTYLHKRLKLEACNSDRSMTDILIRALLMYLMNKKGDNETTTQKSM